MLYYKSGKSEMGGSFGMRGRTQEVSQRTRDTEEIGQKWQILTVFNETDEVFETQQLLINNNIVC